jgi:hypothetical protein
MPTAMHAKTIVPSAHLIPVSELDQLATIHGITRKGTCQPAPLETCLGAPSRAAFTRSNASHIRLHQTTSPPTRQRWLLTGYWQRPVLVFLAKPLLHVHVPSASHTPWSDEMAGSSLHV